jgi:cytochrome c oxidase subunit 3
MDPNKRRGEEPPSGDNPNPEGIGIFTTYMIILCLSVIFLSGMVTYLWMKYVVEGNNYFSLDQFPEVKLSFLFNTILVLISSYLFYNANVQIKKNAFQGFTKYLTYTIVLVMVFSLNLLRIWMWIAESKINQHRVSIYSFTFYLLTGLHFFQYMIALFFLVWIWILSLKKIYNSKKHSGFLYLQIYFHFLNLVWIVLFLLLYFF